jgi:hypothetical protein
MACDEPAPSSQLRSSAPAPDDPPDDPPDAPTCKTVSFAPTARAYDGPSKTTLLMRKLVAHPRTMYTNFDLIEVLGSDLGDTVRDKLDALQALIDRLICKHSRLARGRSITTGNFRLMPHFAPKIIAFVRLCQSTRASLRTLVVDMVDGSKIVASSAKPFAADSFP